MWQIKSWYPIIVKSLVQFDWYTDYFRPILQNYGVGGIRTTGHFRIVKQHIVYVKTYLKAEEVPWLSDI